MRRYALDGAAAFAARSSMHQFAAEALQHDFGRVFLVAVLVGPFAGLQRALEINLGALAQILLGDLGQVLVEDHDAMPLGALFALARRLVAPGIRCRDRRFTIGSPDVMRRTSGSLPRLPTKMTLLTLPAMTVSFFLHSREPSTAANVPPQEALEPAVDRMRLRRRLDLCSHYVLDRFGPQDQVFAVLEKRRKETG